MSKEGGQLKGSAKSCCWCIATTLAIVLGFVLIVLYGWPTGSWAFDWSALGALGTIVTGVFAGRISHLQLQNSRLAVLERKEFAKNLVFGKVVKVERSLMKLARTVEENVKAATEITGDLIALEVSTIISLLEDENSWPDLDVPSELQIDLTSYDLQLLDWLKESLLALKTLEEVAWLKNTKVHSPGEFCTAFLKLINEAKLVVEILDGFERGGRHLDSLTAAFDSSIFSLQKPPYTPEYLPPPSDELSDVAPLAVRAYSNAISVPREQRSEWNVIVHTG